MFLFGEMLHSVLCGKHLRYFVKRRSRQENFSKKMLLKNIEKIIKDMFQIEKNIIYLKSVM
jgi:hypothetical protein